MSKREAYEALQLMRHLSGEDQIICRPLQRNVPTGMVGAELTNCPVCGEPCFKTEIEPDELPEGCWAACTECALRAGIRRQGAPKPSTA
jgi:hypothetical protein